MERYSGLVKSSAKHLSDAGPLFDCLAIRRAYVSIYTCLFLSPCQ